jgi:ABC-type multidrug transport system fused ATPase/permease subunit
VGFSLSAAFFILYRVYSLVMAGCRQGQIVHRRMMKALLYASLGNFFNRVPVGRIINRLTKDLRELDEEIGFKIGSTLATFFSLLGNLIICVYGSTPFILIPMVVVAYISFRIRRYYMRSQIEVARF